jgi:hypothetical protein
MAERQARMQVIRSLDEIPQFGSEREEEEYWEKHTLSEALLDRMVPLGSDILPPPQPRTRPLAIRIDQDVIRRLKALARVKQKGYQSLVKEFLVERLCEEEKREGLLN